MKSKWSGVFQSIISVSASIDSFQYMLRCILEIFAPHWHRFSHLTELQSIAAVVDGSFDWDNDFSKSHVLLSFLNLLMVQLYAAVHTLWPIGLIDEQATASIASSKFGGLCRVVGMKKRRPLQFEFCPVCRVFRAGRFTGCEHFTGGLFGCLA